MFIRFQGYAGKQEDQGLQKKIPFLYHLEDDQALQNNKKREQRNDSSQLSASTTNSSHTRSPQ